jgi:4-amino-4-deoxy-L-arabinose transferase-like glycosyltransferase
MRPNVSLTLLVFAYLLVGSLYALNTPDWQAPDEPAHYNYVRQLASGFFPVIEPGDYDQEYQSQVISSKFDPLYSVESFEYEDYQPPLYYMFQAPIFSLTGGALRPMRLLSVVLGAGVVVLAYLIAYRLFPGQNWLALTAAVFVAFLPQHVAMLAAVNNDSLAELIIAAILLVVLGLVAGDRAKQPASTSASRLLGFNPGTKRGDRRLVILGVLLGLGLLTKVTVYIMIPLIGVVLLWVNWNNWRSLLRSVLIVFGIAGLMGLAWWVRNLFVYGGIDILGTGAHNAIVVGQPRTVEWIAERGLGSTLLAFFQTSFQSFWGQFGWMGVVMPDWVYLALLLFSLLTVFGFFWALARRGDEWTIDTGNQDLGIITLSTASALLLTGTFMISLALYLGYNLTFVQHQGRYLFPALIPIGIGVAIAWTMLILPVSNRWPAARFLLPLFLAIALIGLDLLALFRFIIPALSSP